MSALPPEVLSRRSPSSDFGENQLSQGLISLSLLLSSHLRIFQHPRVRSSTWCYPGFNLLISRSPPLRVYCRQLHCRTIRTRFPFASILQTRFRLATDNNSQTHYAKGKRSPNPFERRSNAVGKSEIRNPNPEPPPAAHSVSRLNRISDFALRISHLAGGQMGSAPTHCMQSVSGSISLP